MPFNRCSGSSDPYPMTKGSGSCSVRQWPSRCQQQNFLCFSAYYFLKLTNGSGYGEPKKTYRSGSGTLLSTLVNVDTTPERTVKTSACSIKFVDEWMRFSRVVRASDSRCRSRNCPGFDLSILRHSGIWGVADETVLNIVHKKIQNIHLFV